MSKHPQHDMRKKTACEKLLQVAGGVVLPVVLSAEPVSLGWP